MKVRCRARKQSPEKVTKEHKNQEAELWSHVKKLKLLLEDKIKQYGKKSDKKVGMDSILDLKLPEEGKDCNLFYYVRKNILFDDDTEVSAVNGENNELSKRKASTNDFNKIVWPDEEEK